jgi:type I restriction enzyme, S subunit
MRNTWPTSTIGDICAITSGGTPSKSNESYWKGSIPWVSAKDLKSDRIADAALHISKSAVEHSATKIAPVGSLLMLVRGMGLANGFQIGEVTAPVAFNQDIRAIHAPANVVPRFLLLALRSALTNGEASRVMSSAAHGTLKIDTEALRGISFPVPPLAEQRRIVGILDEAFAGIAVAKRNAQQNLQNARALFESHLQAIFTNLQAQSVAIGDFSKVYDGPHATPKTVDVGPIFLGINSLRDGRIVLGQTRHVTPEDYVTWTRRVIPEGGDVVFSYETQLGQVGLLPQGLKCCLGRRMALVRLNRNLVDPRYFTYCYISPQFRGFLNSRAVRGATVDRISLTEFPSYRMPIPALREQVAIANRLDSIRDQSERLAALYQQKLTALDELKKSLLARAFAGELTSSAAADAVA